MHDSDTGEQHGHPHGYEHGYRHGHPGNADARPHPSCAEIAERDERTIERLVERGEIGARRVKDSVWRIWNPHPASEAEGAEYAMLDIFTKSGRLFRQGQKLETERGLRAALVILGVQQARVPSER
ncbi:MAG TPA: hypothetical protein VII66_01100 [Gemmatimonadaceae bacterium]